MTVIEYIEGDLFKSPAQVIVNTVNTVGVMGKGIALEFKRRYPEMFVAYRTACEKRQLRTGELMLWYAPDHWILLFPTKEHWRNSSKLEYIESGLAKFVNTYADKNIMSVAFPKLGCGNGELPWDDVRPLMEKYLGSLPIDVYIYLGRKNEFVPEHKNQKETMEWLKSHAKDMSFNGLKDDIIYNSSIVPYTFHDRDREWDVVWKEGLVFSKENEQETILVKEDDFLSIWDEIRNQDVFPLSRTSQSRNLVYIMLESLGYLSEVNIQDHRSGNMAPGYQLNKGSGRMFSLRGN
jgi:O-acetyl-ADP-ribose deacetylase (regulator of RNase III)